MDWIFLLLFILAYIFVFYLTYYIFGYCRLIRSRALTEEEKLFIIKDGISHHTSSKGKDGIIKAYKIHSSKYEKAYSNHFRKCVYFFANAYKDQHAIDFNYNPKYMWNVSINKLTDKQINKFKIRDYDKALMYMGDFEFDLNNNIEWINLGFKEMNLFEKVLFILKAVIKTNKFSLYYRKLYFSLLISMVIIFGIPALIFLLFIK